MSDGRRIPVTYRMEAGQVEYLDGVARERRWTRSEALRYAVELGLAELKRREARTARRATVAQ